MMRSGVKGFISILAAGSMFVGSTSAVAATSSAPIQQLDPWAALAVLSGGASAASLCGAAAAAAAAQPAPGCVLPKVDQVAAPPVVSGTPPPQPIPVPPVEPAGAGLGLGISPLLLGLIAIAGGVALYFILKGNNNNNGNSAT